MQHLTQYNPVHNPTICEPHSLWELGLENFLDSNVTNTRLRQKESGEIFVIPKSPAEVAGEKVLLPIVNKIDSIANQILSSQALLDLKERFWSLANFRFPTFLPTASASPLTKSCDVIGGCDLVNLDEFDRLLSGEWEKKDELELRKIRDSNGNNLLQRAVIEGKLELAEKLIEVFSGTDELSNTNSEGRNVLHLAAIQGHTSLIPLLDGIPPDKKDSENLTPLHLAIWVKHPSTVNALLKQGESLREPVITPENLQIPVLDWAVFHGSVEVLKVLLEYDSSEELNLSASSQNTGTLLHVAIHGHQHAEDPSKNSMLEYLLRDRYEETKHHLKGVDGQGRPPLHYAAFLGDRTALELIHQQDHSLIHNQLGENDRSVVHYAALGERLEILEFLDSKGVSLIEPDAQGKTPEQLIETRSSPNATDCKSFLKRKRRLNKVAMTKPPNPEHDRPVNLVFQGGGPRGIAYVGALQELEEREMLKEVKRVAGTSAGAITAGLLSVGYDSKSLKPLLKRNFEDFLDSKGDIERRFIRLAKDPSYTATFLEFISHPFEFHKKLFDLNGLCSGEKLRKWLEELIEEKTGTPYFTFRELKEQVKKDPDTFKELHVFSTNIEDQSLVEFSTSDSKFDQLIISDAIRASLSIPGIFEPHTLHFKDEEGNRYSRKEDPRRFVDGGLIHNYPITTFDEHKFQKYVHKWAGETNRETYGFSLRDVSLPSEQNPENVSNSIVEKGKAALWDSVEAVLKAGYIIARFLSSTPVQNSENVSNSPIDLAKKVAGVFYNAEEVLRSQQYDVDARTFTVNVSVGMLEFDVSDKRIEAMIQNGTEAVRRFFLELN